VTGQFGKDTTAIKNYLSQNAIAAAKLPQEGIWYVYDQKGSGGAHGNFSDTVTLTYKMSLLDGTVADDHSSTPMSFNLSQLISGLQVALPLFPVGSKGRIFIPSFYGYGPGGSGSIPPNSTLIFDFSVLGVTDYHLKSDTVAINKYIVDKAVPLAQKDPSGIRYTIDAVGNGTVVPHVGDFITCTYSIKLLDGTSLFEQTTPVKIPLSEYFLSWKIIMPLVNEGTALTIYSPSTYAYGPSPTIATIPQNANVIFRVNLIKVN
jgi:FKBP-type peptidyl-prolyl cis-trans isomerase